MMEKFLSKSKKNVQVLEGQDQTSEGTWAIQPASSSGLDTVAERQISCTSFGQ